MGYLIVGPVGTGKSYLAECFAGEADISVIKLKNFREKWVGATESNWERILTTLQNLAPVVVLIDEADAALGNREQEGDSGTSKRVFASLAATMGDTKNRGRLIWILLTSRPELLPIDLKRQGRAEVHIPLFYPKNLGEKKALFKTLATKVDLKNVESLIENIKDQDLTETRSGADIESVLIKAKRQEYISNKSVDSSEFLDLLHSFKSSLSLQIIENQTKAALDEITDLDLLEE
jgi:SpoVK/Ycf46/Vps4 family AAA+-type ATPase